MITAVCVRTTRSSSESRGEGKLNGSKSTSASLKVEADLFSVLSHKESSDFDSLIFFLRLGGTIGNSSLPGFVIISSLVKIYPQLFSYDGIQPFYSMTFYFFHLVQDLYIMLSY